MGSTGSFSVIIPARNAARSIGRCVNSVMALRPNPIEVIVVDDASTDETGPIAESRGARVTRCNENVGPGLARNVGAKAASGEFLAFTDADCEVAPDWLQQFASALEDGSHSGATGPYRGATERTLLAQLIDHSLRFNQKDMPDTIDSSISSNLCVRKQDFERAGGFPAYRLPGSRICYFGNEDEEFAHLLARETGKSLRWLRDNGVYHGYRATVRGYFRQQARYAEAILVSYARFPSLPSTNTNYSRGGGATKVLVACTALTALTLVPFNLLFLAGVLPFLIINLDCAAYMAKRGRESGRHATFLLAAYPFLLLTALAWTKGLMTGAIKAMAGLVYWRTAGKNAVK